MNSDTASLIARMESYQREWKVYNKRRKAFFRRYFQFYHRLEVIGRENVPDGASLIAANHGGGFDLDNVALNDCCLPDRQIQTLIVEEWHYLNNWWGRYYIGSGIPIPTRGGVNYELIDQYLLDNGSFYPATVAIYPEGHSGLFKNRRQIDMFYPGIVRLALRYKVPIVPAGMVGFREACPIFTEKPVDRGPNTPVIMLPPLPLKLKIEFGAPFELSEYYDQDLSKDEEFWVANHVVRPRIADVLTKHWKVELADVAVPVKEPPAS